MFLDDIGGLLELGAAYLEQFVPPDDLAARSVVRIFAAIAGSWPAVLEAAAVQHAVLAQALNGDHPVPPGDMPGDLAGLRALIAELDRRIPALHAAGSDGQAELARIREALREVSGLNHTLLAHPERLA